MNTRLLTIARQRFCSEYVSRATNRHNQRQWCASIRHLGSRWLLAQPVTKEQA